MHFVRCIRKYYIRVSSSRLVKIVNIVKKSNVQCIISTSKKNPIIQVQSSTQVNSSSLKKYQKETLIFLKSYSLYFKASVVNLLTFD